jgi:hypothetical protein
MEPSFLGKHAALQRLWVPSPKSATKVSGSSNHDATVTGTGTGTCPGTGGEIVTVGGIQGLLVGSPTILIPCRNFIEYASCPPALQTQTGHCTMGGYLSKEFQI